MSGATPDPSEPARDPDATARLQLTQALQRAQYAIAWERVWPHLARLLTVAGLFLVDYDVFTGIAFGAMAVVGVAVLGSVTLLPALLSWLGGSLSDPPARCCQ